MVLMLGAIDRSEQGMQSRYKYCKCRTCSFSLNRRSFQPVVVGTVEYAGIGVDSPLATHDGSQFFFDENDLVDHCDQSGITDIGKLMLVDTEGRYLSEIDVDHWGDDLPKGYDEWSLPDGVRTALENLNDKIRQHTKSGQPVSHFTGNRRVVFPDGFLEQKS